MEEEVKTNMEKIYNLTYKILHNMVLYENPHLIKQYGSIKNTLNAFYIYNDFIYSLENETQILILENKYIKDNYNEKFNYNHEHKINYKSENENFNIYNNSLFVMFNGICMSSFLYGPKFDVLPGYDLQLLLLLFLFLADEYS
jgi:hypothetical protein